MQGRTKRSRGGAVRRACMLMAACLFALAPGAAFAEPDVSRAPTPHAADLALDFAPLLDLGLDDTIQPKHAYQASEMMLTELALLHRADLIDPVASSPPDFRPRRPRHVLQEARQVYESIQSLRYLNGLTHHEMKPTPVRVIMPQDVQRRVTQGLVELRALRSVYGVREDVTKPALRDGVTPTHVFASLWRVRAALSALGLPAVVPNDVYRNARMAAHDIAVIARQQGVSVPPEIEEVANDSVTEDPGKTPDDAYRLALSALRHLQVLTHDVPALAIPAGVLVPHEKKGEAKPADVLFVIRTLLAELNALKVVMGVTAPTPIPPQPVGRTPSDVYDVLRGVRDTIVRIRRDLAGADQNEANRDG